MGQPPLVKPLPHGIPSYGSGHGRVVWAPGAPALLQASSDWTAYWICQGEAAFEMKDGRRLVAGRNGFVVLPPLVAATVSETQAKLVLWNCHFAFRTGPNSPPDALRDDLLGPGGEALLPLSFTGAEAPEVLRAYRDLSLLAFPGGVPWRLERAIVSLVGELAAFAHRRTRAREPAHMLSAGLHEDQRLAAIMRRIEADPAHPWRVEDLARSVGVTAHRLHALCRSSHGIGLKAHIVRARLDLAMRLLRDHERGRELSLKEISERCGFSSQHLFSRQFRSFLHITPRAFRAGAALGEREREAVLWGDPVVTLPASVDGWPDGWKAINGAFAFGDNRVTTLNHGGASLVCTRKLWGDLAIEFGGLLPGHLPVSDLSIMWIRGTGLDAMLPTTEVAPGTYRMQVGANGSHSGIYLETHDLAYSTFTPTPGTLHRVRAEIRDNRISLFVDGRRICEHIGVFALTGGFVGIYGFFPGVEFRDLRIYSRMPAATVTATAIGDYCLEQQRYDEAVVEYGRVADAHPGSRLAQEATYKQGVSRYRQGRPAEALASWESLRGTSWDERIAMHRLDILFAQGDHERLLETIAAIYHLSREDTRERIALQWAEYAATLTRAATSNGFTATIERYLETHDRVLSDRISADHAAADVLILLGRFHEVLERYPRQRSRCAKALRYLGREAEVTEGFDDEPMSCLTALFASGRSREIHARFPVYSETSEDLALIAQGRPEQVLEKNPHFTDALLAAGRVEEALGGPSGRGLNAHVLILLDRAHEVLGEQAAAVHTLMALGKADEALTRHGGDFHYGMWPRHLLGLLDVIAGRTAQGLARFAVPTGWELHQHQFHLEHYLLVPFLRELSGDADALARACAWVARERRWAYEQKPWYNAGLVSGAIDEAAYVAQPHAITAPADLLLCLGIRSERAGERAEAVDSYRAFIATPRFRRGVRYDPVPERFAAWRVESLTSRR
jgi:AraC-like DNA-binding protein/tetratricopeptide (TPR) repeat protein